MDSTVNHVSRSTAPCTASRRGRSRRHLDPRGRACTTAACDVVCAAPLRCRNSARFLRSVVGRMAITSLVVAARGVWTARERSVVRRMLRGLAQRVEVISDVEAALLGALDGRPGILVLAGTGSIVLGRDDRGPRGPHRWTRPADRRRGLGVLAGSRVAAADAEGRRHRAGSRPAARCRRADRRVRAPRTEPRAPRRSASPRDRRRRPGAPGGAGRRCRQNPAAPLAGARLLERQRGRQRLVSRRPPPGARPPLRLPLASPRDRRRPGRRPPRQPPGTTVRSRWGATGGAAPLPPF